MFFVLACLAKNFSISRENSYFIGCRISDRLLSYLRHPRNAVKSAFSSSLTCDMAPNMSTIRQATKVVKVALKRVSFHAMRR